jgi:hypothetical protein
MFIFGILRYLLIYDRVASYFQNIEPMRWSPYLEECLGELQKFNEYNTDASLIKYMRMQHMVERINSSPWFDGTDQCSGWKLYPPSLYIRAIQGELQALKNDLQTEFPQNCKLCDANRFLAVLTYCSESPLALL